MSNQSWRGNAQAGALYIICDESDLSRVGYGPMNGRLKVGDVLLCTRLSGDCFYDYQLMDVATNAVRAYPFTFGSYQVGRKLDWTPSTLEYGLIADGKFVRNESVAVQVEELMAGLQAARVSALHKARSGDILVIKDPAQGTKLYGEVVSNDLDNVHMEDKTLDVRALVPNAEGVRMPRIFNFRAQDLIRFVDLPA